MNDYDQAGRYMVRLAPKEIGPWLFPRLKQGMEASNEWLDSQSAPRPGEPDRRCDTIMRLDDPEGPPWAGVIELFTEADYDALDRSVEYVGRFRRDLRHGPHGRDRYHFVAALIFFTAAPREQDLEMNLPGMPEYGMWFGPRVLDLPGEDAIAHLDVIEQNRLGRSLLVWTPLMKGGQTLEVARRWRRLAEPDPRVLSMADVTRIFARLTRAEEVWQEALEGIAMQVSPYAEEIRRDGRVKERRQATVDALEARFPNAVPRSLVDRIREVNDLDKLNAWFKLAVTLPLAEVQAQIGG